MLGSFSRLQVNNTRSSRTTNFERGQLNYTITFIASNQGTFWNYLSKGISIGVTKERNASS